MKPAAGLRSLCNRILGWKTSKKVDTLSCLADSKGSIVGGDLDRPGPSPDSEYPIPMPNETGCQRKSQVFFSHSLGQTGYRQQQTDVPVSVQSGNRFRVMVSDGQIRTKDGLYQVDRNAPPGDTVRELSYQKNADLIVSANEPTEAQPTGRCTSNDPSASLIMTSLYLFLHLSSSLCHPHLRVSVTADVEAPCLGYPILVSTEIALDQHEEQIPEV
ncbi:hypothetical protein QBC41DRAFT_318087 [Cercophora samala]|uniref:Uncharacterized protein n=1 Tax=Cercophora samala TaxID=330535 RepID=A0AA39ZGC3_9PEZI|nr:hypothetical protein QBC41DRAFT_318087 [Cercophora samala]